MFWIVSVIKLEKPLAAPAKSLQSCLTLCDPRDGSPPGFPIPGILQARTLEWVAIFFSNAWKWKVKVKSLNRVRLLATPWTAAYQAPSSMGFSRQECWSGVTLLLKNAICNLSFQWVVILLLEVKWSEVTQSCPTLGDPKDSACPMQETRERDVSSIPGLGRSPGIGNDNPLSILSWKVPWTEEPCGYSQGVTKS